MISIRRAEDRGHFDHGWLKTFHTFSFADYYDPKFMGFGTLRVINEDTIAGGEGFPTHGHRDMEILTYVVEGAIAHRDSTGKEGVIRPGELQRMSAGRGVRHSEYNALEEGETHLLQIWIEPNETGIEPRYETRDFSAPLEKGEPVLLASPNGKSGSLEIAQDAWVWARRFTTGTEWHLPLSKGRLGWLQVIKGQASWADN